MRAVIVARGRVLLVNAYPGEAQRPLVRAGRRRRGRHRACTTTWCARSLEETGLRVRPGRLIGLSEFHNPETGFHQVDLLFRARLAGPETAVLRDPAGVVNRLRWATEAELATLRVKPDILARVAFGRRGAAGARGP